MALLILASSLLPSSAGAAENRYIIDIRPLVKDIRKIEKLKPLPMIGRRKAVNSMRDERNVAPQKLLAPALQTK